jgi:hypothetical protein
LKWLDVSNSSDEMLNVWRRVTVREKLQPYLVWQCTPSRYGIDREEYVALGFLLAGGVSQRVRLDAS